MLKQGEIWEAVISYIQDEKKKENQRPRKSSGNIGCSSLPYLELCGGRKEAEKDVPEMDKEYSLLGKAAHYCMEVGFVPPDAPVEEKEKIEWVMSAVKQQLDDGWRIAGKEIYLRHDGISGIVDLLLEKDNAYLIDEFKFGEQFVSDDTPQVIGNAFLIFGNRPGKKVYTCILQPARSQYYEIERHEAEVNFLINNIKANVKEAKRIPNEKACQFCKACGTDRCPETQNNLTLLDRIENTIALKKFSDILPKIPMMKKAIARFEELALMYAIEGGTIEGYHLKPGCTKRSIKSAAKAFEQLQGYVEPISFQQACKIGVGDIEKLMVKSGACQRKDVKDILGDLLQDNLEYKEGVERLVKV